MGFHLFKHIVIALIAAAGIAGCAASEICLSNQHAVQVSFISLYDNEDTTLNDISVYGLDQTELIYESASLSELFLPLRFDKDTTTFILKTPKTQNTISFVHHKALDFISGECGYVFSYALDSIITTGNAIDSTSIVYPSINYGEDVENVEIYIY